MTMEVISTTAEAHKRLADKVRKRIYKLDPRLPEFKAPFDVFRRHIIMPVVERQPSGNLLENYNRLHSIHPMIPQCDEVYLCWPIYAGCSDADIDAAIMGLVGAAWARRVADAAVCLAKSKRVDGTVPENMYIFEREMFEMDAWADEYNVLVKGYERRCFAHLADPDAFNEICKVNKLAQLS